MPLGHLAARCQASGLAFIQYGKRGVDPGGAQNGAWETSRLVNLESDLRALIAQVKADGRLDGHRIGLIGHSEGTALATWVSGHDPDVRAFAFLGLMRRNLRDIITYQLVDSRLDRLFSLFDTATADGFLDAGEIQAAIARGARFPDWRQADRDRDDRLSRAELDGYMGLTAGLLAWFARLAAAPGDSCISGKNGVRDMPAGWWMDHFAHATVDEAWNSITTPVLVLQGMADLNTPYATEALPFENKLLALHHPDHALVGFEGLSHTFVDGSGRSHADRVYERLVFWIKTRLVP